jgi:heme oxygenase
MTVLREITNDKHREVENTELVKYLFKGEVKKEVYVSYMYELLHIYTVLEKLAKKTGALDGLDGIERTQAIRDDLDELNPLYERDITESTRTYLNYIKDLAADEKRKHLIMAHVYCRHMGDLFGGKLLARLAPGSGRAYQFGDRPALIKAFSAKVTIDLGDEANISFGHFINIFNDLWQVIKAENADL